MLSWINPTGGALYHVRAWRYRESLWRNFRAELAECLRQWNPPTARLLLVGPSAGYCLNEDFLNRFTQIDAIEPDPVAGWLLLRRTSGRIARPITLHRRSFFSRERGTYQTCFSEFPEHTLLFCNVLGQLKFTSPFWQHDAAFATFRAALARDLHGRAWATFHDLLSGPPPPAPAIPPWDLPRALGNPEVARKAYAHTPGTPTIELVDHFMEGFFPELPRTILHWPMLPTSSHWIELIRSGDVVKTR